MNQIMRSHIIFWMLLLAMLTTSMGRKGEPAGDRSSEAWLRHVQKKNVQNSSTQPAKGTTPSNGLDFISDTPSSGVEVWGPQGVYHTKISIDRYFGTKEEIDLQIRNGLMQSKITLIVPVYDCDINGGGEDWDGSIIYPEIDEISINGKYVGVINGDNCIPHTNYFDIPIEYLNFPKAPGEVADNDIRIIVDTRNKQEYWYLQIYPMHFHIEAPRPILIVHGWTDSFDTVAALQTYIRQNLGIPTELADVKKENTPADNAKIIMEHVKKMVHGYKVDKINIIAHSKGGLDSRYLVDNRGERCSRVKHLMQVATPNAGSNAADIAANTGYRISYAAKNFYKRKKDREPFYPGLTSLRKGSCRLFNQCYMEPNAQISTIIGDCKNYGLGWEGGYYFSGKTSYWHNYNSKHLYQHGDGMVNIPSAHYINTANEASPLEDTGNHNVDHTTILTVSSDRVMSAFMPMVRDPAEAYEPDEPDQLQKNPPLDKGRKESSTDAKSTEDSAWPDQEELGDGALYDYVTAEISPGRQTKIPMQIFSVGGIMVYANKSSEGTEIGLRCPDGTLCLPQTTSLMDADVMFFEPTAPKTGLYTLEFNASKTSREEEFVVFAKTETPCIWLETRMQKRDIGSHDVVFESRIRHLDDFPIDAPPSFELNYAKEPEDENSEAEEIHLTMHDDGISGDKIAGDGIYSAQISNLAEGNYVAFVSARGKSSGYSFLRSSEPQEFHVSDISATPVEAPEAKAFRTPGGQEGYDEIDFSFNYHLNTPGQYCLEGDFYSPSGKYLGSTNDYFELSETDANHQFVLRIPGTDVHGCGEDGDYTLRNAKLTYVRLKSGEDRFWELDMPGTVIFPDVSHADFRGPAFSLLGVSDETLPPEGQSFFDDTNYYTVTPQIQCGEIYPAEYLISADLCDDEGHRISRTSSNVFLYSYGCIDFRLRFPGEEISKANSEGPFTLCNISLFSKNANILGTDSQIYTIRDKIRLSTVCTSKNFATDNRGEEHIYLYTQQISWKKCDAELDGTPIFCLEYRLPWTELKSSFRSRLLKDASTTATYSLSYPDITFVVRDGEQWRNATDDEISSQACARISSYLEGNIDEAAFIEPMPLYFRVTEDSAIQNYPPSVFFAFNCKGTVDGKREEIYVTPSHSYDKNADYCIDSGEAREALLKWEDNSVNNTMLLEILYLAEGTSYHFDRQQQKFIRMM